MVHSFRIFGLGRDAASGFPVAIRTTPRCNFAERMPLKVCSLPLQAPSFAASGALSPVIEQSPRADAANRVPSRFLAVRAETLSASSAIFCR
jgi:hypothetical protein